ncbi:MAG TPA: transporter [Chitinophagaceae bacterium]|nr:transporter [Chitinophagaceae bacterium]
MSVQAQDLDPRAYSRVPINGTVLVTGFAYSKGAVVTDPSIALQNLKASLQIPSFAVARSFGFFGKTSQFLVALPFAWGQASATVNGRPESVTRSGFSDLRLRWSVLFKGAPALTIQEFAKAPHKTIFGASLNMVVPTGQYFNDKLINLGANRWAFRPELAISQPFSKKWMIDAYAGLWLFTKNTAFYPGNTVRTQNPMGTFQGHLSYNVSLRAWVALDLTYYTGGNTELNGQPANDRQSNSRIGTTLVLPTGKFSSLKFAASTGAIVRSGANFTTFSLGWQQAFYKMKPKAR